MKSHTSIFWVKLSNWEYWPWYIVYIPVFAYWLWCGIKARAIFYLSAANPGFEYGGVVGSSKTSILNKIPSEYVPNGIQVQPDEILTSIKRRLQDAGLDFPLVVKPDIGERGFHVAQLRNSTELEEYIGKNKDVVIIQEYLDLPVELGVFYYRMPDQKVGKVSSIVIKQLLSVTGNGSSSIRELMEENSRAVQQIGRLSKDGKIDLERIPQASEEVLLEPIGNHVRGTAFLNGQELITDEAQDVMNRVCTQINGFYYGRFDLRCESIEEFHKGKFKIMELNGSVSEPAHIYAPNYPIFKGYKELLFHWKVLYKISKMNHKNGVPYMSFRTGLGALRKSRFARK